MAKMIAIFGATGGQGGSVFRAIQGDSAFKLRAITRNKDSEKAKSLAATGAEVVSANQDDADSLKEALKGAHGVFAVTNYWEHFDADREIKQGKNIADACKSNNVEHLVFSGLESVKDAIGKECAFFDTKAVVEEYMKKDCGLNVTSVRYSFFLENFLGPNKPRKDGDTYVMDIPIGDTPLDSVPSHECGEVTHQVFKQGSQYYGKTVGLSSFKAPLSEYAAIFTRILGKNFKAGEITTTQFAALGFPGCEPLANMYEALVKGTFARDGTLTKALHPNIPDCETWVKTNKDKLLAALD